MVSFETLKNTFERHALYRYHTYYRLKHNGMALCKLVLFEVNSRKIRFANDVVNMLHCCSAHSKTGLLSNFLFCLSIFHSISCFPSNLGLSSIPSSLSLFCSFLLSFSFSLSFYFLYFLFLCFKNCRSLRYTYIDSTLSFGYSSVACDNMVYYSCVWLHFRPIPKGTWKEQLKIN